MQRILFLLLLILVLTPAQSQHTAEGSKATDSLIEHIEEKRSAGISAGYASSNEIRWTGYQGYANLKTKQLVNSSTQFRTASIAKPITAVAVMQLVEQGKLELDLPIASYLPSFPIKGGEAITVRHLLQHAAGISGYKSNKERENKKEYASMEAAMSVFSSRKLEFSPGSNYLYTTYGYVVLGWVIEQVSGQSYEAYVQDNIFEPAGMKYTGVEKFASPPPNLTTLYKQHNQEIEEYRAEDNKITASKRNNLSNRIPGGGFYTTVEDLLRFGQAILNHQLIKDSSLKMLWTDTGLKQEGNPYGMGWFLYGEHPQYGNVFGHGGAQTGTSSQLMIAPDQDLIVVVLSNTSRTWEHVFGVVRSLFEAATTTTSP